MPLFNQYKLTYYSNYSDEALIQLYLDDDYVGAIRFERDGARLINRTNEDGEIMISMPISRFNDIMTILLHESPLYVNVTQPVGQAELIGILGTVDKEPTGEMEP